MMTQVLPSTALWRWSASTGWKPVWSLANFNSAAIWLRPARRSVSGGGARAEDAGSRGADSGLAVTSPARGDGDRPLLLAEDNIVNQKVALAFLHKIGLRAEIAGDGQEVMAKLRENDCRLVLMDVQMHGMDGIEATCLIRDPATPVRDHAIHIIALTAHAVDGYKKTSWLPAWTTTSPSPSPLPDCATSSNAGSKKTRTGEGDIRLQNGGNRSGFGASPPLRRTTDFGGAWGGAFGNIVKRGSLPAPCLSKADGRTVYPRFSRRI